LIGREEPGRNEAPTLRMRPSEIPSAEEHADRCGQRDQDVSNDIYARRFMRTGSEMGKMKGADIYDTRALNQDEASPRKEDYMFLPISN
jgi:hypothetical protein